MNKQEFLESIVGYLPYELEVFINSEGQTDIELVEVITRDGEINTETLEFGVDELGGEIKLFLRPMSQLTEEITVDGETFVPVIKLSLRDGLDSLNRTPIKFNFKELPDISHGIKGFYSREYLKPSQIQMLYKYHFDIHGLIGQGLAVEKK